MDLKKIGGVGLGVLTLVTVASIALVIFRLELTMLYTLALILVGSVGFTVALVGVAFALRAWKSEPDKPDRERIIERHTIEREGRLPEAPKIHLLESKRGQPAVYPELLRAAYAAGARRLSDDQAESRSGLTPRGDGTEVVEAETQELDGEWRVWPGTCNE